MNEYISYKPSCLVQNVFHKLANLNKNIWRTIPNILSQNCIRCIFNSFLFVPLQVKGQKGGYKFEKLPYNPFKNQQQPQEQLEQQEHVNIESPLKYTPTSMVRKHS